MKHFSHISACGSLEKRYSDRPRPRVHPLTCHTIAYVGEGLVEMVWWLQKGNMKDMNIKWSE